MPRSKKIARRGFTPPTGPATPKARTFYSGPEYLTAKLLTPIIGVTAAWLSYHSRNADGPIRRIRKEVRYDKKGAWQVLHFHVQDAFEYANGYNRYQNRGKVYPGSVTQTRLASPAELREIEEKGLTGWIQQLVKDSMEARKGYEARIKASKESKASGTRGALKMIKGGRR